MNAKKFLVKINKGSLGIFTINGIKIRPPAEFVVLECELAFIQSKLKSRSITDYEIISIKEDPKKEKLKVGTKIKGM